MTDTGFVLVASPFTGAFAWTRVAAVLRERGARVAIYDHDDPIEPPIVIVGHSGAGPRLPALARDLGAHRAVYVDALLPHPGRSWSQTVPEPFVTRLEAQAVDGRLPPWPEWWGDERMRELVPDDALRERFVRACPAVPIAVIREVMPDIAEPESSFVQLSAAYEPETTAARARGWPVVVIDSQHLALLTDPASIADVLLDDVLLDDRPRSS